MATSEAAMEVRFGTLDSPVGSLLLAVDCLGFLMRVHFMRTGDLPETLLAGLGTPRHDDSAVAQAAEQLTEYFAGARRVFDLVIAPQGTPFQQTVWAHMRTIPYGRTATYHEIGVRLGRATTTRAVGQASGANPIPILIPCHRVVGAHGDLVGYGGGLPVKAFLLRLEGVSVPQQGDLFA
jgi:methylated-DNA-[protein]-cysteine S-methyltransferase